MPYYIRALLAWRLVRQQSRLLERIRYSKQMEALCFARTILAPITTEWAAPDARIERALIHRADRLRRQRRRDTDAFLSLQEHVDALLE